MSIVFADDSFLLSKSKKEAAEDSAQCLTKPFKQFAATSGMSINFLKSQIIVTGVYNDARYRILKITYLPKGKFPSRYLGVLITSGRLSSSDCQTVVDKITARIKSWSSRHLPCAGKATSVNSVLTGVYGFEASKLVAPHEIIQQLETVYRNLLWRSTEHHTRKASLGKLSVNLKAKKAWT